MRQRSEYNSKSARATVAARFGSACLFAIGVGATSASHANPSLVQADANALAPGSYQWEPSIAPDGSMNMVVDLTSQRAFVYRDGKLIGVTTIASGKPRLRDTGRHVHSAREAEGPPLEQIR